MNPYPFSMVAIVIFGGFNALLLVVSGLLLAFTGPLAEPSVWQVTGGMVLLTIGALIGAAVFGLLYRRAWGRKLLCWGLLFCIPLNIAAIFPMLQNHRMTIGNTLLQILCMAASCATIFVLTRKPAVESLPDEQRIEGPPVVKDPPVLDEDRAFTFDRSGYADRLQDN